MSYEGTCTLLLVCLGPSAQARDCSAAARASAASNSSEGGPHTHVFERGSGIYRVEVSGGHDQARWSMTVEDYY